MKTLPFLYLLSGLSLPLAGQSFDGLNPSAPEPAPEPEKVVPVEKVEPVIEKLPEINPELVNEPARYAGIDLDAYIKAVSSTFSMRARERDPLGRHQDPNYRPPVAKTPTKRKLPTYKKKKITPFVDIIAAIRITATIPGQKRFLVSGRAYRTGDTIPLRTAEGTIIKVRVVDVQSDRVTFRHTTTNELAEHSMGALPGGMKVGGGGSIVPAGVVSPDDSAPLDISDSIEGNNLSSSRR